MKQLLALAVLLLAACGDSGGLNGKQTSSSSGSGSAGSSSSSGSTGSSSNSGSGGTGSSGTSSGSTSSSSSGSGAAAAATRLSILATAPVQEGREQFQRFELRLDRLSTEPVTVGLELVPHTAAASEASLQTATALIPAGSYSGFAHVRIADDASAEAEERYQLRITSADNAQVELAQAQGVIVDNDEPACDPAQGLCAGVAEGALRVPIGTPLGGYLRPPVGGEYAPALEALGDGDLLAFFNTFAGNIPLTSEGGGANVAAPNEARRSPYSTLSPSSRGYYDTLYTKAVALRHQEQTVVFVRLDTIGMLDEIAVRVRQRVKARTGTELGDGLIMSATHTHDGPGAIGNRSVKYFWAAVDVYHQDLFESIAESVADVVIAALAQQRPARVGHGMGTDSESLNSFRRSRSPYTPERVAEQNALRQRLGLIQVDEVDAAGGFVRTLAMMVNFAAHGIIFDVENLYFSGDALGGLERSLESRFPNPVVVMHIQGAGGDVSPRADGNPKRQRLERFGELLAPQVMAISERINNFTRSPRLALRTQRFILNRSRLGYQGNEYPYEFGAVQCNAQPGSEACIPAPPNGADDVADNGVAENDSFVPQDSLLSAVQVGTALIITQPGEPLAEQGLRLLEASPFPAQDTFIWGYAMDHIGYILADLKTDWLLGGTEGTTTFWGWKQGGLVLARATALMQAVNTDAASPAHEFNIAYQTLPATAKQATVSARAGFIAAQPSDIPRFAETAFAFEGGDPVLDFPVVTLEEEVEGGWQAMRRPNGKPLNVHYEHWIDYALTNGAHRYTVRFEPAKDFPVGRYRFRVQGRAQLAPGAANYTAETAGFVVRAADILQLSAPVRSGNSLAVSFAYPALPTNYRLVDPRGRTDNPAPVRDGSVRFVFSGAEVLATGPELSTDEAGRITASYRATVPAGEPTAVIAVDRWGNRAVVP